MCKTCTSVIIVLIFCLLLSVNLASAQTPADQIPNLIPKITPLSPNAASLGKYGDYQVNLFTGLPQISIPIYEAKSGGLTVPISLSYHAAGIKYTDQASWIGLGWSLNAGGMISRKVAGLPDENHYLSTTLKQNIDICTDNFYFSQLARGITDAEPDVFSYSFPSGSGKFLLRQNNQSPFIIPYAPIKISHDIVTYNIKEFKVTDESGTQYTFGKNADGTYESETTNSYNAGQNLTAKTSWPLTQINAPNSNDQITFKYISGGTATYDDQSDRITVQDKCYNGFPNGEIVYSTSFGTAVTVPSYGSISQQILSQILFENGKIEFYANTTRLDQLQLKSLDEIKVFSLQNNAYKPIKTIKFIYSYFKDKNNVANLRLKLDAVQTFDENNVLQEKYSFQYHTNSFSWDVPIGSKGRDYWGYYNGKEYKNLAGNQDLIPKQTISYFETSSSLAFTKEIGTADRNTYPNFMTEGVLKRIDFPTGGYTEFSFETNRYKESNGTTAYAGGLRISQIKSYDGYSANPVVKTYKYGSDELGYGLKNFFNNQNFYNYEMKYSNFLSTVGGSYRTRVYLSNSSLDLDAYDGSTVVYPYVTEYYGDPSSNIGKIVYMYDDGIPAGDIARVLQRTSKVWKESYHWKRGYLTSKRVVAKNGNPISTTMHSYSNLKESLHFAAILTYKFYSHEGNDVESACLSPNIEISTQEYMADKFFIPTGVRKLIRTQESVYDQDDATGTKLVSTTTNYQYNTTTPTIDNPHLQVIETKQTTSHANDEEVVTKIKYPLDYSVPASPTGAAKAIKALQTKNIVNAVIEKYVQRQNADGSNSRVVGGQITSYKENLNNTSQIVVDQIYLLETNSPITLASASPVKYIPASVTASSLTMDNRYRSSLTFQDYDPDGNLTKLAKSDDVPTSFIWSYNNTLPIAEVKYTSTAAAATTNKIAYTSFENGTSEGGWTFGTAPIATTARTGKYCYSNGNIARNNTAGSYIVSYWAKGSIGLNPLPARTVTGITQNGWTYYEHYYTFAATTLLTLTCGTNQIDELRLYPQGAQMTTFTYNPLEGVTTQTDAAGISSFYEYDAYQRLKYIKDQDGNILKSYVYHFKGQP